MWSLKVLIVLCTLIQWEANGVHGWWYPPDCYSLRFQNAPSGMYYIQPLGPNTQPIRVYCEMTIGGGGFTFLPRSLTRTSSASRIVRALFRDRYNVLLKLKKKSGSESKNSDPASSAFRQHRVWGVSQQFPWLHQTAERLHERVHPSRYYSSICCTPS